MEVNSLLAAKLQDTSVKNVNTEKKTPSLPSEDNPPLAGDISPLKLSSIDEINIIARDSKGKDTPPMFNQIFNPKIFANVPKDDYVPLDLKDTYKKPPQGKFSIEEVEYLEKLYGKEGINQSKDEQGYIDKKKFGSFLSENTFPPFKLGSSEDRKNLFNVNV